MSAARTAASSCAWPWPRSIKGRAPGTTSRSRSIIGPQINGLSLEFARDGTIDLGGEGHEGRTEVILRGIFAKVFSQKRKLKFAPKIDPSNHALAGLHFLNRTHRQRLDQHHGCGPGAIGNCNSSTLSSVDSPRRVLRSTFSRPNDTRVLARTRAS